VNRPFGKRQKARLESRLSRGSTKRDQPLMRACRAHVLRNNLEVAIEPDFREIVLGGLAGAEAVYQAHRLFEDSALSEISNNLMSAQSKALERLHDALTTGQMMMAARAAGDLSWLGGKAEGLAFFGEFAAKAVSDSQSRSNGGLEHAKKQKAEIDSREDILTGLIIHAVAAAGARNGWNSSWLARWMLKHWPSDGLSASDLRAGVRVISNWVRERRKTHPDDFWIPAGPVPSQEGQAGSVGTARCGSTRSNRHDTRHPSIAA
jgi:hypothetical protein